MKKFVALLLGFALAFGSSAAFAAKPKTSPEDLFKKLDSNNDGKLSLEEFKAGPAAQKDPTKAEAKFKKMDTNNHGFLTLEEFKAGMEKKPK